MTNKRVDESVAAFDEKFVNFQMGGAKIVVRDFIRAHLTQFQKDIVGDILGAFPFKCVACGRELEFGASGPNGERRGCYSKKCPRVKANNYYSVELPFEKWAAYDQIRTIITRSLTKE